MGQRLLDQCVDGDVVLHVAFFVENAVLPMGGERIEGDVSDHSQLGKPLTQRTSGALGNALTALLRPRPVLSLGFSTALFASIGAISGYMACQQQGKRKAMLPVAAAAALLAMLGTEGENTDYAAHLAGLGCGLALGAFEGWRARNNRVRPGQWLSGAAAALLVAGAWWWAFAAVSN